MEILIIVLVYAGFLYATFKLAQSKNREPAGWMLARANILTYIISAYHT